MTLGSGEQSVSDPAAGEAVLYYRNSEELEHEAGEKARSSKTGWINQITEHMLAREGAGESGAVIHVNDPQREAMGIRSNETGWLLVFSAP